MQPQPQPVPTWGQNQQRVEIVRVNGENGARAYQLPPNSNTLLLDESAPLVWLVQTDGAGYKTVSPYTITPYQAQPSPDYGELEERIRRLEDLINGRKSDSANVKRGKQSGDAAE
jgi:hypothetical protein